MTRKKILQEMPCDRNGEDTSIIQEYIILIYGWKHWNIDKGLRILTHDLSAGAGAENVIERRNKKIRDEITFGTDFRCTLIKLEKEINLDRVNFVALEIHYNFSLKENVPVGVFSLSNNVAKYSGAAFYVTCTKRNDYMECFVLTHRKASKIVSSFFASLSLKPVPVHCSGRSKFLRDSDRNFSEIA
uniref:Uncharacterized protein n=1 Tax=Glossina pallidipes TaxID=7398 RepID=A0A1A9ZPD2_GLOPL